MVKMYVYEIFIVIYRVFELYGWADDALSSFRWSSVSAVLWLGAVENWGSLRLCIYTDIVLMLALYVMKFC